MDSRRGVQDHQKKVCLSEEGVGLGLKITQDLPTIVMLTLIFGETCRMWGDVLEREEEANLKCPDDIKKSAIKILVSSARNVGLEKKKCNCLSPNKKKKLEIMRFRKML